jgi:hypothetical protein
MLSPDNTPQRPEFSPANSSIISRMGRDLCGSGGSEKFGQSRARLRTRPLCIRLFRGFAGERRRARPLAAGWVSKTLRKIELRCIHSARWAIRSHWARRPGLLNPRVLADCVGSRCLLMPLTCSATGTVACRVPPRAAACRTSCPPNPGLPKPAL